MSQHRIRIARVITRLIIGGPTLHTVNLSLGLDPQLFETKVICGTENAGEDSMLAFVRSKGIEPIVIPEMIARLSVAPRDLRAIVRAYRFFQSYRPHIVATHTAKAGVIGRIAARLAGVPIIVHTYHGHILRGYYSGLVSQSLCRMEQMLGLLSDGLIAVSPEVKKDLVELGVARDKKIVVVPLGLELDQFGDSKSLRGEFRDELGIKAATPIVGIVGRIVPIKNHRLFLEAARLVLSQRPDAQFVIVGDGLERPVIEQAARDLGIADRVVFTGWRRDLPRIYADLDVLVVSSINEGTPVSAIEAMAAACPVVATRVGGIPDVIQNERTGLLVPAGNAPSLAAGILRLLNNLDEAQQMAARARTHVLSRYRTERLVSDIQQFYESLLRAKNVPLPLMAVPKAWG